MGRAGYTDDIGSQEEQWAHIRWRGQVASAIRGKRGQAFLRELVEALDAMPEKRLISNVLEHAGNVCAIGSVGVKRGIDMTVLDPEDPGPIAASFGIAEQLVREIEYENDEAYFGWDAKAGKCTFTPEGRWKHMRAWAAAHLREPKP